LSIEPLGGFVPIRARPAARTASLLSGGVDGLTALRANRLAYPADHPESIRDCILLFGANDFESTAEGPVAERLAAFERLEGRLRQLASEEDFSLLAVHTNTRLLSRDYACWASVGFGAANAAVAHVLSRRVSKLLLASDGNGVDPPPGGAHPLLDRYFSTEAVEIWHEHAPWTRFDKLRLLADWPAALRLLQPCHYVTIPPPGQINCGRCEKCVRTMAGLLALGKLKSAPAFPYDDVTADMIRPLPVASPVKAELLAQLVEPLRAAGRHDLVTAIERKLRTFRLRAAYQQLKRTVLRR
jgi:hypothetical protein